MTLCTPPPRLDRPVSEEDRCRDCQVRANSGPPPFAVTSLRRYGNSPTDLLKRHNPQRPASALPQASQTPRHTSLPRVYGPRGA
ncbi:hypothetical protein AAFF_G00202380 [Aldrovandia affinis]|uniref:Uncharacterized protein n=1 Tax=Aldrovandia affinis TaxID=143900 RepID=A0AAD7SY28_9TELE|nr:hypothetical protein AAFF_G00202380 [Aldrovandia affinis]